MLGYLRSGSKRTKAIWLIVTIATVFTFIIGFSFFGSMGRDPSWAARQSGEYGAVNGAKVSREMWQAAFENARSTFKQKYGSEPVDRDLKIVQEQAWHDLVTQQLLGQQADRVGLKATDNEVLLGMQRDPPTALLSADAFKTNGRFDPQKYSAALANPNVDWAPFEDQLRTELPVRKLQRLLMSSLKLSQPELHEAFLDRYQRLSATVLQVPPADTGSSPGSDAELQKVFDKYRTRMASSARTQLEVLPIPIQYSDEEVRTATEMARGLCDRARKGESYAQLAKDYSEGANADQGGVLDRWISPNELGPLGQSIQAHKPGDILDPYREGGSIMVLRILDPKADTAAAKPGPPGTVKLAQILIKIRPAQESLRDQYQAAQKIAERARSIGLSKAASEKGMVTSKTPFYDLSAQPPPQLAVAPASAEWGTLAKKGEVSPVFTSTDLFMIAQVSEQHAAGPPTRAEVNDQLKQIADMEVRVDRTKSRADQVAAAIATGKSLEDAAKAAGLQPFAAQMSRAQPDPRLMVAPELQGALWAAKPGKVVGPVRTPGGWFFGRVEGITSPPDTLFNDTVKGQLTTDILSRRQRSFFDGYLRQLRAGAKVKDNRSAFLAGD